MGDHTSPNPGGDNFLRNLWDRPRRHTIMSVTIGLLATGLGFAVAPASAEPVTHPELVPQTPATGYPAILKTPVFDNPNPNRDKPVGRQVFAAEQVGRAIVSGGDFFEIRQQDGTVLQQKYFAAWNIDSKQMICAGKYVFDNEVLAIEPGPTPNTLYVGGRFKTITGADGVARSRARIAKLDLTDCSVSRAFAPDTPDAKVDEIEYGHGRLFVGGDFDKIGAATAETLVELDPGTGSRIGAFSVSTEGESTSRIRGMELNDAGTRLALAGRFGTMTRGGTSIPAPTAVLDVSDPSGPVLTAHQTQVGTPIIDMQDAAVSPDGSVIGLVYGTATTSDYVYLIPTTEASVAPRWSHFMRDSSFGIGISNRAVYVGGHFCRPDDGPRPAQLMSPRAGHDTCTGTLSPGGVWRSHLAALSLIDGTPLEWNPGQSSFTGARTITAVERGLLVGYDGEKTGDLRVGATAFFDFGPATEPTTTVSMKVKGCKSCRVRLAQKAPGSKVWHSSWKKVTQKKVSFSIPTFRTAGLTVRIKAPWEKKTKKTTEVVIRYKGKKVGEKVPAKAARKAKKGTSCWAGTTAAEAKFKIRVKKVRDGRKVVARAWVKKTKYFRKPLRKTPRGVLSTKRPTACS
jgi:trimeric autotransporter adhesin